MINVIEVRNLRKEFGGVVAVHDISFDVGEGEILVIVGSSGCGKTTTLRCIAGLENATSGSIRIGGELVVGDGVAVPPEKRGVGMMFQSYALWPHMNVFDNIAYGLKIKRVPSTRMREIVGQVLELVGLAGMGDRYPSTLSGGQQQRVALARAVAVEQKVILLDEPLSNLDAKLREEMRNEIRSLVKRLKMTAIHITHDQTEAMAIADKLIYMRNGRVEQSGTSRELYRKPTSRHVAGFIGTANFFDGRLQPQETGAPARVAFNGLEFETCAVADTIAGTDVVVAIRPENLILGDAPRPTNSVPAKVVEHIFLGDQSEYWLSVAGSRLKARSANDWSVGDMLHVSVDPSRVIVLPRS